MSSSRDWLIQWFEQRSGDVIDSNANYFDTGWVDSLGVIDLISDVEREFGIRFDQSHFRERRFATVAGLVSMVDELRGDAAT